LLLLQCCSAAVLQRKQEKLRQSCGRSRSGGWPHVRMLQLLPLASSSLSIKNRKQRSAERKIKEKLKTKKPKSKKAKAC